MAPSRRKGANKTTTASTRRQWKIGDLVLAKVKGFPAWPATVSEPEEWGYPADWKKVLVYFFGTQQIAFCNPADVEDFTEERKQSLLDKRHGKGADFVRAVNEIIDCFDKLKKQAQVNSANGSEEVNIRNENNSDESLSISVKDEVSAIRVKSLNAGATNDLYSLTEASVVAAGEDVLQDEELHSNSMFAETPASVTYSTRSKTDATHARNCVAQRISARRLRSSSRQESSQLQNSALPFINNKRRSRCSGTNSLHNRSLRRSKRIMKSPDESDGYDINSPFVSNDSIEENDSEMMTGDSDSLSFNDGCTVDSGCKTLPSEPCVESYAEEMELNNRLDFQTNTVISKKRRKSDKKRHCSDSVVASKRDLVVSDVEELKTECCSPCNNKKFSERYAMNDGDEHLPLVKRARIRMGRPSPAGKEGGTLEHKEENSLTVSKGLVIQSSGCLNYKVDDPPDEESVPIKEDPQNLSFSPANPAKNPQPWEARRNNVVGEAALPPTKRLHRALEAMSANVVEYSQGASNCFPTEDIHYNVDLSTSLGDCSEPSMRSKDVIGLVTAPLKDHSKDNSQLSISEFHVASNTEMSENNKSVFVLVSDYGKTSYGVDGSNHELVESAEDAGNRCLIVSPTNVKRAETDAVQSPSNERSTETKAASQHFTPELPNLDEELARLDRNTTDLSMVPTESCKIECSELEKAAKRSDPDIFQLNSGSMLLKEIDGGSLDTYTSIHIGVTDSNGDEALKMPHLFLADKNQDGLMSHFLNEVRPLPMGLNTLPSTNPLKDATIGQKQCLLDSNYIPDDNLKDKNVSVTQFSSSLTDKPDSVVQASPPSSSTCNMPASDNNIIENNSCSLDIQFHLEKAKLAGKSSSKGQALSSFEANISSLTRTKESIGRATRIAIDCAKFGLATKVVEILARNLERESSLHRKVDLFFLVDSITQCSRGIKGDGGMYPSAIQALLPRLLLAAAPPGSCSLENHRQCLKVLRVWQEREILPEPIIRHHIQELDSLCVSYPMGGSRRPLRNERAFDDPIREMEGMLVDEYGSNSSFQLPGFCMPPMLRDDDGGIDSDGENFEAVTPEHNAENLVGGNILTPAVEKHSHILEDVDGELEMEDLAPSCEVEVTSTGNIGGLDYMQRSHHQSDNNHGASYTLQLPKVVLLQSAPLLKSPTCPPCPPPPSAFPPVVLDSSSKGIGSKLYSTSQNFNRNLHESMVQQSIFSRVKQTTLGPVHHRAHERKEFVAQVPRQIDHRAHERKEFVAQVPRQIDDSNNSRSFTDRPSNFSGRASNSIHQADGAFRKAFHLRPPLPSTSNQFSYVQERVQLRRDITPPSHANRFRTRNAENGNFYRDRERIKFAPRDNIGECWRPPLPFISGPVYSDGARLGYAPMSYDGPPREPASPHNRWNFPPRPMNRRHFTHYRTPVEGPIPVAHRGPNYWRPR